MPIELQAERLFGLPIPPIGWEIAAMGVGFDSTFLMLAAEVPFEGRMAGKSSRYRLHRTTTVSQAEFDFVSAGPADYSIVQPIDNANFLLVTSRTYNVKKNGQIWRSDGSLIREFSLGDGIEDVQTSARSEIWVSYFDEGVFGNGNEPGLACFDLAGKRVFSFADQIANDGSKIPPIDDCYALNVSGDDEVWLYYYMAFPLVKLVSKRLAGIWPRAPGLGSHAFAVGERSVLFAGDYGAPSSITRYFPESGRSEMGHAVGDGQQLEFTRAMGRAHHLYLVANSAIWLLRAD
jgi:hypothetical protein